MDARRLTLASVEVRPVVIPLRRPVVSKVGRFDRWPLILIDLHTEEGVVGRSYLEPYLERAARYIVPAIQDLAEARKGKPAAARSTIFSAGRRVAQPRRLRGRRHDRGRGPRHGGLGRARQGGGRAACGAPRRLDGRGPRLQQQRPVAARRLDGLGEEAAELVAEGGFDGAQAAARAERLEDDLDAIAAVREAVGADVKLMVDFNQGLALGDALHRCHALDDQGLYWFEEPITYDNLAGYAQLARELKTPVQLGENFYGPRELYARAAGARRRLRHARPDAHRRRVAAGCAPRRSPAPPASRCRRISIPRSSAHLHARHRDRALARVAGLGRTRSSPSRSRSRTASSSCPTRPGCGIEWDETAVKRFQVTEKLL